MHKMTEFTIFIFKCGKEMLKDTQIKCLIGWSHEKREFEKLNHGIFTLFDSSRGVKLG